MYVVQVQEEALRPPVRDNMSCLPGGNGSAQKKQKLSGPQSPSAAAVAQHHHHQSSPHRQHLDSSCSSPSSHMQHHQLNLISNSAPATNSTSPYQHTGNLGRSRVGSAADVDLSNQMSPYTSNSVYVNGYAHGSSASLGMYQVIIRVYWNMWKGK